jgi:hypothetical protein
MVVRCKLEFIRIISHGFLIFQWPPSRGAITSLRHVFRTDRGADLLPAFPEATGGSQGDLTIVTTTRAGYWSEAALKLLRISRRARSRKATQAHG